MKKILLIMFCIVLLVAPMVSAEVFTFDNILNYKNNDLTVDVINTLGFTKLGTIELKSHKSVDQVITLEEGWNVRPNIWYNVNFDELYENGLGDLKFIDLKTGKEVEREWYYVYEAKHVVQKAIGDSNCDDVELDSCESSIVGYREEEVSVWERYNSNDIPKGELNIGIKVYVEKGDLIDGIFNIAGKDIKKHAQWQEGVVDYIYIGGAINQSVIKYDPDLNQVAVSSDYGGGISGISLDNDYIYYGGAINHTIIKAYKSNLSYIINSFNYGGAIRFVKGDDDYIYYGGQANQTIIKAYKSNLSYITHSSDYGGLIGDLELDDNYIYYGGDTNQTVIKAFKSNLSYITNSSDYGGNVYDLELDDDYIYYGGYVNQTVIKAYKSNLSYIANTVLYGGNVYGLEVDNDYIYYGGVVN